MTKESLVRNINHLINVITLLSMATVSISVIDMLPGVWYYIYSF